MVPAATAWKWRLPRPNRRRSHGRNAAWVPTLGILAYVYGFYLIFLGTEKVHRLDATKAVIVTLVAVLVTGAIMLWVLGWERVRRPLL